MTSQTIIDKIQDYHVLVVESCYKVFFIFHLFDSLATNVFNLLQQNIMYIFISLYLGGRTCAREFVTHLPLNV